MEKVKDKVLVPNELEKESNFDNTVVDQKVDIVPQDMLEDEFGVDFSLNREEVIVDDIHVYCCCCASGGGGGTAHI